MADTGKQSPLGMNVLGGLLQHRCLQINRNAEFFMGVSTSNTQYTYGKLVEGTVLRMLTWAINDGFTRGVISNSTYNNLISISGNNNECHALGNSKPPTYIAVDPSESWAGKTEGSFDCKSVEFGESQGVAGSRPGPANAGYSVVGDTDYGQQATWLPYDTTNPNKSITQWGWIRCHALQAHNEFNFHAKEGSEGQLAPPKYEAFAGSFNEGSSFAQYTNKTINVANNADSFLEGTFSNMDDLITGDVTGISKFTRGLAWDLQNLQKVFDFKRLDRFGFPSTLLQQLHENGGLTQDLNLNLGSAGLSAKEIRSLSSAKRQGTPDQERKIYTAFLGITGDNLVASLSTLTDNEMFLFRASVNSDNDDYRKIRTLADILNPWHLFLSARTTLTVPVYNDEIGRPTGSKTYYLIYNKDDGSVNSAINTTNVKNIVGTLVTAGAPPPSTFDSKDNPSTVLPKGFDSYLGGPNVVIPAEIGLACAALRYSFLQISNIEQITPGKLGNCIQNLQILDDASVGDGANGTPAGPDAESDADRLQRPINVGLVSTVSEEMGLGSGYGGTYTLNDFFGCMSGVPYWWESLYNYLAGNTEVANVTANASTSELAAIYQQLFLAVSWEAGTGSVQTTLRAEETGIGTGEYDYFYTVTGVTLVNDGGGYGRGGAPDPVAVISGTSGATATLTIGRSDKDTGSNDAGTFGRITSFILTSAGIEVEYASAQPSATPTDPGLTVAIETPPIGTYAWLPATGATNSPDGTAYNYDTVTQYYINAANAQISSLTANPSNSNQFGFDQINYIWEVLGKQMKVEQRTRYNALGRVEIPSDPFVYTNQDLVSFVDNIPEIAKPQSIYDSIRGRVTLEAIVDRACEVGQNIVAAMRESNNEQALANCGIPINNNISDKIPLGIRDTLNANGTAPGAKEGIQIGDIKWVNPEFPDVFGPGGPIPGGGGKYIPPNFVPIEGEAPGTLDPIINGDDNPQVGPTVSIGPPEVIISSLPPLFGGDPARVVPPEGDQGDGFNSGGGKPSGPNPPYLPPQTAQEAIDKVIHCNCDCWDLIG